MAIERIETLVIGGGQAGLSMSEQLGKRARPHLVLERHRIAERWRSERWDGLHANGPAWHDRLALMEIPGVGPDEFATHMQMAAYFEAFAARIAAPIRCGVEVTSVEKTATGFRAEIPGGAIEANNVVVATGPFQRGVIPPMVPPADGLLQIHSTAYKNPGKLPAGAVLVIGAGSSGSQIADELARSGRQVYLSVGKHERPPRRYRGHDFCWWLGKLGKWDQEVREKSKEHVTIAVTGAYGGYTMDFRELAGRGVTLLGSARDCVEGTMRFEGDLVSNVNQGDAYYLALLDEADAFVKEHGLELPEEPAARRIGPDPASMREPILALDLAKAGVSTIIWATGFALDLGWVKCAPLDARGAPVHKKGVTAVPGLYFLGLSWLSRRASSFIFGVERDAAYLAEQIAERARS